MKWLLFTTFLLFSCGSQIDGNPPLIDDKKKPKPTEPKPTVPTIPCGVIPVEGACVNGDAKQCINNSLVTTKCIDSVCEKNAGGNAVCMKKTETNDKACKLIGESGQCSADDKSYKTCKDGKEKETICPTGTSCDIVAGKATCKEVADSCQGYDNAGSCSGDILKYCTKDTKELVSLNCKSDAYYPCGGLRQLACKPLAAQSDAEFLCANGCWKGSDDKCYDKPNDNVPCPDFGLTASCTSNQPSNCSNIDGAMCCFL